MKRPENHHKATEPHRRIVKTLRAALIFMLAAEVMMLVPAGWAQGNAATNDTLPPPPPPPVSTQAPNPAGAPSVFVRLSYVQGTIEILRGDTVEFPHAVMNMPLTEGNSVRTGADGRAEIEFDDGSVARITPDTTLTITQLTRDSDGTLHTALEQRSGLVYYELRSDPHYPFQVTFAGSTVSPTVNSTFRVDLGTTPAALAVLDGSVRVQDTVSTGSTAGSYFVEVRQGHTIEFQPSASAPYTLADWIAPNGFDDWNHQLDQEAAQEAQNQTQVRVQQGGGSIMDSGIGWGDLDTFGGWYPLAGYGMVWQPWGIGPGFDPYGFGMWGDFGGFGYTWISGYPWGWLPFHYGLWTYIGGFGWGWLPCNYAFGGTFGYGYGGYGYGLSYRRHNYPYTNVYRGPRGYAAPVPPTMVRGQSPRRLVQVGNWKEMRSRSGERLVGLNRAHPGVGVPREQPRDVKFRGAKVAPLRSSLAGVQVPVRNAALYNNYPARAFGGNLRAVFEQRAALRSGNAGGARLEPGRMDRAGIRGQALARPVPVRPGNVHAAQGPAEAMRRAELRDRNALREPLSGNRPLSASREEALHIARGRIVAEESSPSQPGRSMFGRRPAFSPGSAHNPIPMRGREFGSRQPAFGPHSSFGPRGGFRTGPAVPSRAEFGGHGARGGEFHSGGMRSGGEFHGAAPRSGGGFQGGGFRGGGFHGGAMPSGGGFHGGGSAPVSGGGHSPR